MTTLTVGYLAKRNARKYPDEDAAIHRTERGRVSEYTFSEFDDRTDRIANGLRTVGVEKRDTVALYMKNNVETLEIFVGTMKLGALPVPINHRFEGEEVSYVLEDSDPRVAVLDEFGAATIAEIHDDPVVPVETFLYVGEGSPAFAERYESFVNSADETPIDVVPSRDDAAALMYTSGTTGKPKGCLFTHGNLLALAIDGAYEEDHLEQGNRHMIVTPLFHVGAFVPFVTNFYVGGTTIVVDGFEPERILEFIEAESVNSSYFVPTQSRRLLDIETIGEYDISSFESYGTGAAPSSADLKQEIIETFDTDIVESFGQTEAMATRLPTERTIDKADSVGIPSLNLEMKVVDERGDRLPRGEVGRAGYKGPMVFDGYYELPEKNDDAFDEDGWFISDDLVRRDEEGFVYFVGRADDMIVSGGENIHPAAVEEVIHGHLSVNEVAVLGVPDETWGERVKAVIVPNEDEADLDEEEIVSYVEGRIAGYKKPREVEFRSKLPRNPTGKVLKEALK